jgi:hypothetical protein
VRRHGQQARVTYFCAQCQLLLGYELPRSPALSGDGAHAPGAGVEGASSDRAVDPAVDPDDGRPGGGTLGEDRHPAARLWRERSLAASRRAEPVAPARTGSMAPSVGGATGCGGLKVVDPLLARRAAGR